MKGLTGDCVQTCQLLQIIKPRGDLTNSFLSWSNLVRLVKGAIFKMNKTIFTDAIYKLRPVEIWVVIFSLCSLILDGATAYVPTK